MRKIPEGAEGAEGAEEAEEAEGKGRGRGWGSSSRSRKEMQPAMGRQSPDGKTDVHQGRLYQGRDAALYREFVIEPANRGSPISNAAFD